MKSKYHFALKFFTETKNHEQLDLLYKEIEGFLDNLSQFKFFIELNLQNLDPKLEAQLTHEEREQMKEEDFLIIFNDYRLRSCENTFSNFNYNFELFKYALEKIFDEEKKQNELLKKETVSDNNKGYNYSMWITIAFAIGMCLLLGANYNKFFGGEFK